MDPGLNGLPRPDQSHPHLERDDLNIQGLRTWTAADAAVAVEDPEQAVRDAFGWCGRARRRPEPERVARFEIELDESDRAFSGSCVQCHDVIRSLPFHPPAGRPLLPSASTGAELIA